MSPREERLSEQFYEWELRGRGWQLWAHPVSPEPPFRPFYGHYVVPQPIDDGHRPTFLSSLISRLSSKLADQKEPEPVVEDEEESEPDLLDLRSC